MGGGFNRRGLIKSTLAAGAALVLPGRASAQELVPAAPGFDLNTEFDNAFAKPVAATPSAMTPYQRRVLDIARRERERAGASLWRADIVGVADFAMPSSKPRLHFANLEAGTVQSFLVAHGRGSDPEHDGWLKLFSNTVGSEATSRGAYLTGSWYEGKYGTSIRLQGIDADNSHALERAIVMHPAWYAAADMLPKYGKLGRSEGCFAMSPDDFDNALLHMAGGRLLYADRIGEA
ncbi:MAG: murein L,D-transpeptidase catalytic domain family protein [Sphingomonadales bacterium]|nr:murein L,D-transpeptidase catalytic domain family protein [Sphingomonadales bacterium]